MNDFYWKTTGEVFYGYTNFSCRNADSMSFIYFSNHRAFFLNKKNFFLLHIKAAPDRWIGPFYTFPFWGCSLYAILLSIKSITPSHVDLPLSFLSLILMKKKNYTFLWSGHYKGNQFLIKLGCWCWYLTILQLSFLIHVHVYLLST